MRYYSALLLSILLFTGCANKHERVGRGYLLATTGMIGDALKNIAGDSIPVISLMGPGVDPHLYKATQGDLQRLSDASLVFYNGLHLEGKMGEILEKLGHTKPVIAVSSQLDENRLRKVPEFNNNFDPHIWFDVSLWSETIETITAALIAEYPDLTDYFQNNSKAYVTSLDSLHNWVKDKMAQLPAENRILVTAHDAFGYFGDAYGVEVKGLQGISTLSEFGLRDISDLVEIIVNNKVKSVFVETSVSSRAINAVVEGCISRGYPIKIGGNLYSDAMGDPNTEEGTYIGMVKANVNTIYNSLK